MYQSIKNVFLKSLIQTLLYISQVALFVFRRKSFLILRKSLVMSDYYEEIEFLMFLVRYLLETICIDENLPDIPNHCLGSNHFYAL